MLLHLGQLLHLGLQQRVKFLLSFVGGPNPRRGLQIC